MMQEKYIVVDRGEKTVGVWQKKEEIPEVVGSYIK